MKINQRNDKKKVLVIMGNFMGKLKTQLLHSPPKAKGLGSDLHWNDGCLQHLYDATDTEIN